MSTTDRLAAAVLANNRRMARHARDVGEPNPRSSESDPSCRMLEGAADAIRGEWRAFDEGGGRLPRIEQVIGEHQGNDGAWRAGLLVARGRPTPPLAELFPRTVGVLRTLPGLRFALWSLLDAGAELPLHRGPNGGVLRLHLGVDCPPGCGLDVDGVAVPYEDGRTILFDDTAPHAAWNRSDRPRVTLFCEILRPAPRAVAARNRVVQELLALDPRFRRAPRRAAEWHHALNG